MISEAIEWIKGLLGGEAGQLVQEAAESYGHEALEDVQDSAQGLQDGVDTATDVAEDPGGAAVDAARDQLPGDN
ncbi:hypothetical protein [Nocardiopsis salina]|uniref:hypothetical protein n=1 Tax=Nocardiopsis salina TaxID=245836 RepID=UPI00034C7731|nr:hypothetical protein [Nocardiopsis salina]